MKFRTILLFRTLVVAALFAGVGTAFAQSEILAFDDLSGLEDPVPNGYGGFQWNNFSSYNTVYYASIGELNGLNNGVVSLNNVISGGGDPASMMISGGSFNLNSAYLMAVWNDGLQVEVQGFVGAIMAYDEAFTVATQGATLINFNYLGVDKVTFISSGGVPHGFSSGSGTHFGMDNLSVTLFPDAGTGHQDFTYTTNAGQITITGYNGPGGNVTIPSTIDGLPVTAIGAAAFANRTNLTTVAIPASTRSIDVPAFQGTEGAFLSYGAFGGCTGLRAINVDLQNSVYSSLDGVLFNKDRSELFIYPQSRPGTYYTMPDTVIVVGGSAFLNCSNLAGITIGNNVGNLGHWAFLGCSGLTRITIPDSVTNTQDAQVGAFGNFVDGGVFYGCSSLTNVVVGKGLSYLGIGAFSGCSNLVGVYFKGNAPTPGTTIFYVDVFGSDPSTTVYYLPGTTGWGSTYARFPSVLWNPQIQTGDASFGVRQNGFGFNIIGTTNIPVVIEACTNLGAGSWIPLQSCTLTNGLVYFGDPQWTNYPRRFYRIRSP